MRATISVIIPTFNAGKYVGEAIASALNQTRPPDEVVVVDDASTDDTREVIRSFGDRIEGITLVRNGGQGNARNVGVRRARGSCVAFLDADDVWTADHLARLEALLDRWPEAAWAYCRIQNFGANSRIWPDEGSMDTQAPALPLTKLMRHLYVLPSGMLLRRSAFDDLGGFNTNRKFIGSEDCEFILRLVLRHHRVIGSARPTLLYRIHADQSTNRRFGSQAAMGVVSRLHVLRRMKACGWSDADRRLAWDRALRFYEELLALFWGKRDVRSLRRMVGLAVATPRLWPSIFPHFLLRALVPAAMAGSPRLE